MTETRIVLVTAPSPDVAERICRGLLEERLVACGSILPGVRSLYMWEGRLRDDSECLVVLKTDRAAATELVRRIPELHPYEVPEILVLNVDDGHDAYTRWVADQTGPAARGLAE